METPNLDALIEYDESLGYRYSRSELSALKQRVEEMEQLIGMMLKRLQDHPYPNTEAVWFIFERSALSLLSAEAREALQGGSRG